jgi:AGZA family xanthine/uracil permease-like MFS transporter
MSPAAAMGVIVVEGVIITVLVVLGLREAIMRAVPLALKRSIGVGIGLFILFIGLSNGGLIGGSEFDLRLGPAVGLRPIVELSQWIFLVGLLITFVLYALRIKAALIISIVVTSVLAFVTGITSAPAAVDRDPEFQRPVLRRL